MKPVTRLSCNTEHNKTHIGRMAGEQCTTMSCVSCELLNKTYKDVLLFSLEKMSKNEKGVKKEKGEKNSDGEEKSSKTMELKREEKESREKKRDKKKMENKTRGRRLRVERIGEE